MASSNNQNSRKQKQILHAATALFLENGYGYTSLDAVADKADVSKPTIYSHFKNKEALFAVVVEQTCDELNKAFAFQDISTFKPRQALLIVGTSFGDMLLAAHTGAVFRMVIAESRRMRSVGQKLHARIGETWEQSVASYLKQQSARGTLAVSDPRLAARHFLCMLKEWFLWPELLGLSNHFTAGERKRVIAHTVKAFLSVATHSSNR